MRRALTLWVGVCLLPGCYGSHGSRRDAGPVADGGPDCGALAGYVRCGYDCSSHTGLVGRCPEGQSCFFGNEFCADDIPATLDSRGSPLCGNSYCYRGDLCLVNTDFRPYALPGPCVDDVLCQAAVATGDPEQCRYSDGTYYEHGPPYPSTCPPPADPEGTLCGGVCGECPQVDYPATLGTDHQSSCVGLSDTRGLGVCTILEACVRYTSNLELARALYRDALHRPLACLVQRDSGYRDGFADRGYAVFASSCRAYVSRFPDGVYACLDLDWTPLP